MKASELRLFNLVEYPNWNNDGSKAYFKIRDIYFDDGRIGLTNGSIMVPGTKLEYLKPIPLTEEWLFKFGFHLRDGFSNTFKLNVEKHQYDCAQITYSEKEGLLRFSNGEEKGTTLIPHIKYVHQLQNLYFALTGKELKQQEQ
jgi:hypothetical protein